MVWHQNQVECRDLVIARGGHVVADSLSFTLARGDFVQLEGANGAGKSSLLLALAGFLALGSGSIRFIHPGGTVIRAQERAQWVGYLGHENALKPYDQPLREWADCSALFGSGESQPDPDFRGLISRLDLVDLVKRPIRELSAGQKRRVALARLFVLRRPIWLLDEPLSGIDQASRAILGQYFTEFRAEGGIIIAASHETLPGAPNRIMRLQPAAQHQAGQASGAA